MLGHVSMSAVMVQEAAGKAKVTGPKLQQLLHIVLSHHGEQEKVRRLHVQRKKALLCIMLMKLMRL